MTWGKFRQMTAKEYCEITDIANQIQDLADRLKAFDSVQTKNDEYSFSFTEEAEDLVVIAQSIQDGRDTEMGDLTDADIEQAYKQKEPA